MAEPEWAFLRAGYWPDWVRNKHPGVEPKPTAFNRPRDHYIDFPFIKPADKELFDEAKLQPDVSKDNIVAALQRHAKVLSSDAKDEDRAVSLCWLLHLIGDVHQPLHGTALYSRDYKNGDQGGNLIALAIDNKAWRLHWYWDSILDEDVPAVEATAEQAKVYDHVKKVVETLHDAAYKREKFADQLQEREVPRLGPGEFRAGQDGGLLRRRAERRTAREVPPAAPRPRQVAEGAGGLRQEGHRGRPPARGPGRVSTGGPAEGTARQAVRGRQLPGPARSDRLAQRQLEGIVLLIGLHVDGEGALRQVAIFHGNRAAA